MNSPAFISFQNVSFSYGTERVLSNCSFEVPQGSHLVLKGASGSGKSTILKLILGFLKPNQGTILYQGRPLGNQLRRTLRTRTSWLPANPDLGDGTVQEVIHFPFEFEANRSVLPQDERILELFEQLNLDRQLYIKPFRELSTGQRQRVALALCMLLDKPLLLLDEPTSALDVTTKERVADLLLANTDKTIISTSHDSEWTARADKTYEL